MESFTRLKLYYLALFIAYGCILPYLSIFYKISLGLSATQVGILTSVMPIMNFLLTPHWSLLADKNRSHVSVLVVNSVLAGIASLCFLPLRNMEQSPLFFSPLFVVTLLVKIAYSAFLAPLASMLDCIVLDAIKSTTGTRVDPRTLYGRQRAVGSIAYGGAAFIASLFLKDASSSMDALFFGFMAWSLIFAGLLASPKLKRLFHLETKDSNQPLLTNETVDVDKTVSISEQAQPKSKSFWSLVMEIVSYESVCGYVPYFWLMTFVQGSANSLINNYLFLMLTEELHAPSEVLGWTSLTRVLLEIPFFVWSGTLSNQIQRLFTRGSSAELQNDARWMLVFAVALTALRVGLYTLMSIFKWNPIIDVFIELLHGIIYATFYASAVQIAAVSAPAHLQATSQGIYAAIFSGFGATFGNFFGGIIYNYLGPSTLFAMTFVLCSGSALLYSFYIKFSRTRRPSVQVVK